MSSLPSLAAGQIEQMSLLAGPIHASAAASFQDIFGPQDLLPPDSHGLITAVIVLFLVAQIIFAFYQESPTSS